MHSHQFPRSVAAVVVALVAALACTATPAAAAPAAPTVPHAADARPNGCTSPLGGAPSGVDFKPACDLHDICYQDPDHKRSQQQCDDQFHADMLKLCDKASPKLRRGCRHWAEVYYRTVTVTGKPFYWAHRDPDVFCHQQQWQLILRFCVRDAPVVPSDPWPWGGNPGGGRPTPTRTLPTLPGWTSPGPPSPGGPQPG